MEDNTYNAEFGPLNRGQGPDNSFVWTGNIEASHMIFSGKLPIYIFTKNREISSATINLAENVVSNIDHYLEKSILFIKETFISQRDKYQIKEAEYDLLNADVNHFPLDFPELTFWEDSVEWMIRFAEGSFAICHPFGISVNYCLSTPTTVDNLEDSESIGD